MQSFRKLSVLFLLQLMIAGAALAQPRPLPGTALYEGLRLFQEGDPAGAIPHLEKALSTDSLQVQAYVALAQAYLFTGRFSEAESLSQRGVELFSKNFELKQLAAEAAIQTGDLETAGRRYESLLNEFSSTLSSLQRKQLRARVGQLYTLQGATLFEKSEWENAAVSFEKAVRFLPDSASSYYNLAVTYQNQGLTKSAAEIINEGLERHPENAQLKKLKAFAGLQEGDEVPLDEFEILYENNSEDPQVGIAYAALLYREKKPLEARKVISRVLEAHSASREVHERILSLYRQNGDILSAMDILKRMREHFPEDNSILSQMADYHVALEQWDKAHAMYDTLLTIPDYAKDAAVSKVGLYERQDKLAEGVELLNQLGESLKTDADLLAIKARLLEKRQEWTEAVDIYEALLKPEQTPTNLFKYGRALHYAGRRQKAEEALLQSSAEAVPHPQALYILASYKAEREETGQACSMLELAFSLELQRIERLQNEVLGSLQGESQQHASQDNASVVKQIEEADQLSEEIFDFYGSRCPEGEVSDFLDRMLSDYSTSGRLYRLAGNYAAGRNDMNTAEQWLRQAAKYAPRFDEAHRDLARNLEKQQKYQEALVAWERHHALNPTKQSYQKLVELHKNLGSLDSLVDRWKMRFHTTPADTMLYEHLLQSLQLTGRFKEIEEINRVRN